MDSTCRESIFELFEEDMDIRFRTLFRSCRLLSGRGLLVTATVWLLTIGGALSEDDFICIPPNTSGSGPLMPTLPESYHIVYELNDLVENTSTFHNEW